MVHPRFHPGGAQVPAVPGAVARTAAGKRAVRRPRADPDLSGGDRHRPNGQPAHRSRDRHLSGNEASHLLRREGAPAGSASGGRAEGQWSGCARGPRVRAMLRGRSSQDLLPDVQGPPDPADRQDRGTGRSCRSHLCRDDHAVGPGGDPRLCRWHRAQSGDGRPCPGRCPRPSWPVPMRRV